jgi:hypothetical protein
MSRKRALSIVLLTVLALVIAGAVGLVLAQGPDDDDIQAQQGVEEAAIVDDVLAIQGRLTNAGGTPINGTLRVTYTLYDSAGGGAALCTDADDVTFVNGLFTGSMSYCTSDEIDGRALYLGIRVGADAEMTPRQAIRPVPYAYSLRPGAVISGTVSGAIVHVENWATNGRGLRAYAMADTGVNYGVVAASRSPDGFGGWFYNDEGGSGLYARGSGSGLGAPSLEVSSTNASGIGIAVETKSTDAAIVSTNLGSGDLFRGFGAGGGEDEIRITNNGTVETKADSYFFIPGNALVKNVSGDSTRWDSQINGSVWIYRGSQPGSKLVYIPVTLPAVLYGQPVKIDSVRVYYKCVNATNAYIADTRLYKQTDADSYVTAGSDATDHKSTVATSYTLTLTDDAVLSSSQGILGFYITIFFANDTDYVQLGGVRFQLGHHALY